MKKNIGLVVLFFLGFSAFRDAGGKEGIRYLEVDGASVKTTFNIDAKFIGKYQGAKQGYLVLNADGTGRYRYDYFGFAAANCKDAPIELKWGFLLDENNEVVRFERGYGYSYPIVYFSTSKNCFRGCTKISMVDYLLVYNNGTITVASSDDWVKVENE